MEQFLQFIFILAIAKYCIDAALTRRVAAMAAYAAVLAAVAFALWPTVIGWRGDMIADLLSDGPLVADGALVITLEAVAGIFISILMLDSLFDKPGAIEPTGPAKAKEHPPEINVADDPDAVVSTQSAETKGSLPKADLSDGSDVTEPPVSAGTGENRPILSTPEEGRRKALFVLKVLPGVICFFAVVYFELLFFRSFVGIDFLALALSYAAIVAAGIFLLSAVLGRLMPGESTKLEAKIVLDMAILLVGLLVNASIASYNISSSHTEISPAPMILFVAVTTLLAALGLLSYKVSPLIKKLLHGFHK